jgi:hypothetical protein
LAATTRTEAVIKAVTAGLLAIAAFGIAMVSSMWGQHPTAPSCRSLPARTATVWKFLNLQQVVL